MTLEEIRGNQPEVEIAKLKEIAELFELTVMLEFKCRSSAHGFKDKFQD